MTVFCISEDCPVGCGTEVVLLKPIGAAGLFSFCPLCSCCWRDPSAAHFDQGLNEITSPSAFAPRGVELPTQSDIETAGLGGMVTSSFSEQEWWTNIDDINDEMLGKST